MLPLPLQLKKKDPLKKPRKIRMLSMSMSMPMLPKPLQRVMSNMATGIAPVVMAMAKTLVEKVQALLRKLSRESKLMNGSGRKDPGTIHMSVLLAKVVGDSRRNKYWVKSVEKISVMKRQKRRGVAIVVGPLIQEIFALLNLIVMMNKISINR